jgi:hypothetical protein
MPRKICRHIAFGFEERTVVQHQRYSPEESISLGKKIVASYRSVEDVLWEGTGSIIEEEAEAELKGGS